MSKRVKRIQFSCTPELFAKAEARAAELDFRSTQAYLEHLVRENVLAAYSSGNSDSLPAPPGGDTRSVTATGTEN